MSSGPTTTRMAGGAAAGAGVGDRRCTAFMVWTVFNAHYPALFIGGFLFSSASPGPRRLPEPHRSEDAAAGRILPRRARHPRRPAGLVDRAGAQPACPRRPLFLGATILTAFNDNALITYLATLVPNLDDWLEARRRGGCGDRRRAHRDRQRRPVETMEAHAKATNGREPRTNQELVVDLLRESILSGKLRGGSRLIQDRIATELRGQPGCQFARRCCSSNPRALGAHGGPSRGDRRLAVAARDRRDLRDPGLLVT